MTSMAEFLVVDKAKWRGTLQQEDIPYPFIKLSDTLDFIGVSLQDTFMKTRKVNCDIIEKRVS